MPIELIWDDSLPNVVHYRFQKGWTWEEFRQTALTEHSWGETLAGQRYDIIGDLTEATIPQGTGFTNVLRLFDQGPHNRKTIIVVGSTLARAMIDIARRLYPRVKDRFYFAEDVAAAQQMIQHLRAGADQE